MNSLVVVFPTEPVTATNFARVWFRYSAASLPSAATVSSTITAAKGFPDCAAASGTNWQRKQEDPASRAWGMKSLPSFRSPLMAAKRMPSPVSRESMATAFTGSSPFAPPYKTSFPPVAPAISAGV